MPLILIGVIGGTLLAAGLKALFDIGSTITQNKYNSPRAMRNRLKQAGLPLAYMYRGNVATQNTAPQLSIDPNLGTVDTERVKASKLQRESLQKDIQVGDLMSGIKDAQGNEYSNRAIQKISESHRMHAEAFLKDYERQIKQLELQVEREAFREGIPLEMKRKALQKATQQVKNLLEQAGLMKQLKKIRGFEEKMNYSLTQDLDDLPDWISSLLKIILIATKRS